MRTPRADRSAMNRLIETDGGGREFPRSPPRLAASAARRPSDLPHRHAHTGHADSAARSARSSAVQDETHMQFPVTRSSHPSSYPRQQGRHHPLTHPFARKSPSTTRQRRKRPLSHPSCSFHSRECRQTRRRRGISLKSHPWRSAAAAVPPPQPPLTPSPPRPRRRRRPHKPSRAFAQATIQPGKSLNAW